MTCAHTCLSLLIKQLLETSADVLIRCGDLPDDELGATDFDTRIITVSRTLSQQEFRATLAHELWHLLRGPTLDCDDAVEVEETIVEEDAARFLVPASHLPVVLAAAIPEQVAAELVVDVATARLGIELARRDQQITLDVA